MPGRAVDVSARVSQYEVTSTPLPGLVGRGRLRLVWVRPPDVLVEAAGDAAEAVDAPAAPAVPDAVGAPDPDAATIAMLDAYRVTRVPGHPGHPGRAAS